MRRGRARPCKVEVVVAARTRHLMNQPRCDAPTDFRVFGVGSLAHVIERVCIDSASATVTHHDVLVVDQFPGKAPALNFPLGFGG